MNNFLLATCEFLLLISIFQTNIAEASSSKIDSFKATPPIHNLGMTTASPAGMTPTNIKSAYHLPSSGGQGTIAIIAAYDDGVLEKDLAAFSKQFNLPSCTSINNCFEKVKLSPNTSSNKDWSLEKALDIEWAHAIAPQAKILLVEAENASGSNLLKAIDYARARKDVVAISISWGGREFQGETELDSHFISQYGAAFFASSVDSGAGVSWPSVSKNVVAVGGTTLHLSASTGSVLSEQAWSGSGGGISSFETQPDYQKNYDVLKSRGMRAVPDVSYNADPRYGFSVYHNTGTGKKNWYVLGGTSAGAPQWAAIHSLGLSATLSNLYGDKASANNNNYFRDIKSGSNGTCAYYCDARSHYDFVTGLGSPLTFKF